jgi:hypothetical protein
MTDTDFYVIGDGQTMLDTAVSLHLFGELGVSSDLGPGYAPKGFHNEYYSRYGLGMSLLEQLPLMFASRVEKTFGPGRSNVLFPMTNLILTALTALLVALSLKDLGCRFRTAALAAVAFAFATPAWCYVSYDFSEPLQSLCVAAGFWLIVKGTSENLLSRLPLIWAGSVLGFAVMSKASLLFLIPGFALYLWLRLSGSLKERLRPFVWFIVPIIFVGAVLAGLNVYRFGSITDFGYQSQSEGFTNPLLEGLYAVLLGPNKGLVFYAPVVILVPWSLWKLRKSHLREAVFFATTLGIQVILISMWWSPEGGASWGPRYILPVVPLAIVCAAMILESSRWTKRIFAACMVAGILVNLLGVLIHFLVWINVVSLSQTRLPLNLSGRPHREYIEKDGQNWFQPFIGTAYLPALSPIKGHAWLLRMRYMGIPFSVQTLNADAPSRPPVVHYPPLDLDFSLFKGSWELSHLRSAHFWLWEAAPWFTREKRYSFSVYGFSILRQGNRAAEKSDFNRAVWCYEHARDMLPGYADPVIKLSKLQWEQGRRHDAIQSLTQYVSRTDLAPDDERRARIELANCVELSGDRNGAIVQLQRYLALHPNEGNRAAVEQHLAQLSAMPPK